MCERFENVASNTASMSEWFDFNHFSAWAGCERQSIAYKLCLVAMIRKRRNQKEILTPKTEVGKTKLSIGYLYLKIIS